MSEHHTILGGKVHVYKRPNSSSWQCATYLAGKNRRTTTKEDSLSKAKEFAEDWYLQLRGKLRDGELVSGKPFRDAAKLYLREFDIMTQGQRNATYARGQHARTNGHLVPFFGSMVLPEITAGTINEYRIHRLEESKALRGKPPAHNTMHQETRFKKKLPAAKFRYDDSLAPSMEWDGQNPARDIRILAPIVGVRRKKDSEAQKDTTKQNERVLLGFRNAYVFDVSQTDGVDLPTMHEVSGDPGENIDRLAAFLKDRGIQLVYNPNIAPALGMSYGGRIAILPGQSKAETFATLVHETAHELLHKSERRTATTKTVRETEAEAVAFVVGKAVGLVTGSASADYIQLYHGNASLLAESLEVIQQTASVILAALEPPIAEEETTTTEAAELAEVAA